MKTRAHYLYASFVTDDGLQLVRRIVASHPEFSTPPKRLSIDLDRVPITATWLEDAIARSRSFGVMAHWGEREAPSRPYLEARPHAGEARWVLQIEWSIPYFAKYVPGLGAWLAAFGSLYRGERCWEATNKPGDGGRVTYGFSLAGAPGWGCMFVGQRGHEQLVSRRWLEHGPWLLHRFPGDISLIQFHDLDADPQTAITQALPGHRRLGDNDIGGWLRVGYTARHEIKGLYVPADQTLRIVCSPGRVVSEREMLDACAERLVGRYNTEKPIRAVRFVFIEPADAQRHLHEMWLRELEVWTFTPDGKEVRLDADYHPEPTRPAWVDAVAVSER